MLTLATAMISEASLSFLGLGDPSMNSWGLMINFALIKGGLVN
jgi:peptide/nickel transport system permease protein